MFGPPSLSQNNERKINGAVERAMEQMETRAIGQSQMFASGLPDAQQNGFFDDTGDWQTHLRCGHPLSSGKLAP